MDLNKVLSELEIVREDMGRLHFKLQEQYESVGRLIDRISSELKRSQVETSSDDDILPAGVFNEKSVVEVCDLFIDYVREARNAEQLKKITLASFRFRRSPLMQLWKLRVKELMLNAKAPLDTVDVDSLYDNHVSQFKPLQFSEIESAKWGAEPRLVSAMRANAFLSIFGNQESPFQQLQARFILIFEMIRWAALDPFESGLRLDVKNERQLATFILPGKFLKTALRLNKTTGESVKLSAFFGYLERRRNEIREGTYIPESEVEKRNNLRSHDHKQYPADKAPFDLTNPRKHANGRVMIGVPISQSIQSKTPYALQTVLDSSYYLVKVKVIQRAITGTKENIMVRLVAFEDREIQREFGIVRLSFVIDDTLNKSGNKEDFTYEQFLGMNPVPVKKPNLFISNVKFMLEKADIPLGTGSVIRDLYINKDVAKELYIEYKKASGVFQ